MSKNFEDLVLKFSKPPLQGLGYLVDVVYQGNMAATSTLGMRLPHTVPASNAVLVITSAYDRGSSTNPRNVQVNEDVACGGGIARCESKLRSRP